MPTDTPLGTLHDSSLTPQSVTKHLVDPTKPAHKSFLQDLSVLCEQYGASLWAFARLDGKPLFLERRASSRPHHHHHRPHSEIAELVEDAKKLWDHMVNTGGDPEEEISPNDPRYTPKDAPEDDAEASVETEEPAPIEPNAPIAPSPETSDACVPAHASGMIPPEISVPSLGYVDTTPTSAKVPEPANVDQEPVGEEPKADAEATPESALDTAPPALPIVKDDDDGKIVVADGVGVPIKTEDGSTIEVHPESGVPMTTGEEPVVADPVTGEPAKAEDGSTVPASDDVPTVMVPETGAIAVADPSKEDAPLKDSAGEPILVANLGADPAPVSEPVADAEPASVDSGPVTDEAVAEPVKDPEA